MYVSNIRRSDSIQVAAYMSSIYVHTCIFTDVLMACWFTDTWKSIKTEFGAESVTILSKLRTTGKENWLISRIIEGLP